MKRSEGSRSDEKAAAAEATKDKADTGTGEEGVVREPEASEKAEDKVKLQIGSPVVYRELDRLYPAVICDWPFYPAKRIANIHMFATDGSGKADGRQRVKHGAENGCWHEDEDVLRAAIKYDAKVSG